MSELERVKEIITEMARHDEEIAVILQKADNVWEVGYEDVAIELELHEGSGRLVMTADLGVPPAERRLAVFEALLSYAMLWRDTGFVRAAAAGGDGSPSLIADVGVADLRAPVLTDILANFAGKSRVWREYVTSQAAQIAPPSFHLEEVMRIWA